MINRKKARGSILVAALLLFIILIGLGFGVMSGQAAKMRVAQAQARGIQAKELAWAGWEDVRVKLGKDLFIPAPAAGQEFFSYSEDVYDSTGDIVGTYTVVVNLRYDSVGVVGPTEEPVVHNPEGIYLITCVGKVGPRAEEPEAERTLYFEVDMVTFDVIRSEDRGSL